MYISSCVCYNNNNRLPLGTPPSGCCRTDTPHKDKQTYIARGADGCRLCPVATVAVVAALPGPLNRLVDERVAVVAAAAAAVAAAAAAAAAVALRLLLRSYRRTRLSRMSRCPCRRDSSSCRQSPQSPGPAHRLVGARAAAVHTVAVAATAAVMRSHHPGGRMHSRVRLRDLRRGHSARRRRVAESSSHSSLLLLLLLLRLLLLLLLCIVLSVCHRISDRNGHGRCNSDGRCGRGNGNRIFNRLRG